MEIKKGDVRTTIIADTGHEIWAYHGGGVNIPASGELNTGDIQLFIDAINIAAKIASGKIKI